MNDHQPQLVGTDIQYQDDLRPEYDLTLLLKDGMRGKYTDAYARGTNLVLLAPDVAEAFPTEEAVNQALRLVIRLSELPASPSGSD